MYPSRRFDWLFSFAVLAAGVGLLASSSRGFWSDPSLPALSQLVVWLVLLILAAVSPVPVPRRSTRVSLSPMLEFAALLVFGLPIAGCLVLLARLGANLTQRWLSGTVPAPGCGLLSVVASGLVYNSLGGGSAEAFVLGDLQAIPLAASAVTLLITQRLIVLLGDFLHSPDLTRERLNEVPFRLGLELVLMGFALPIVLVHSRVGLEATALLFLPLLLALHSGKLWERARRGHFEAIRSLMSAVDATDPFTRGHSERIARMCVCVGRRLGLRDQSLEELEYAALLHDIGRTAIQHDILVKPHQLSRQEQSVLRTHPRIASEILRRISFLPRAADIVLSHHEQPDGNGYPENLSGSSIPVASRIIMVVAAFDAMTSDRPYRRGLTPEAAFVELRAKAGTQFFGDIVEVLHQLHTEGSLFEEVEADEHDPLSGGAGNPDPAERALEPLGSSYERVAPSVQSRHTDVPILEMPPACRSDVVKREFLLSKDGSRKLLAAVLSDVGCVRKNNEDSFGMFHGEYGTYSCLLIVADGMGGAAAGEVASKLTVETVRDYFFGEEGHKSPDQTLREAIQLANQTVHSQATEETRWQGMGTTCVAAAIVGSELTIGHVGDSRAYLIEDDQIRRLTQDHSLEEELAVMGTKAGEGAKHVLTRSIGQAGDVEVDLSQKIRLMPGSTLVLCSDGLSNLVEEKEILEAVRQLRPDAASTKLVELARERGGPDNITLQIARLDVD